MTQYLIMCRSLTRAQTSRSLLERAGITATVTKAPQSLSGNGCGYAVSVYRHVFEAIALLKAREMLSGKVFRRDSDGEYTEVSV